MERPAIIMDMEDMFQEEIANILGDTLEATNHIPMAMYQDEQAFRLMLSSVSMVPNGYRLYLKAIPHDTLMQVLSFIRDILPVPEGRYITKVSRASKELQAIGLSHMSRYIIAHKNGTYTLDILPLTYDQATYICRALYSW